MPTTTADWFFIVSAILTAGTLVYLFFQIQELKRTRTADILFRLKDSYTEKVGDAVGKMWEAHRKTGFHNYEEFKKEFGKEKGDQILRLIGNHFAKIGFLAREEMIDPTLALNFIRTTVKIWEIFGPVDITLAERRGTHYREDFEWLYNEWMKLEQKQRQSQKTDS